MEFSIVWSFSLLGRELVLFTAQQLSPNSPIGGKIIILWGDFELGARLLTYEGILLTFGGVIINYIILNLFCYASMK